MVNFEIDENFEVILVKPDLMQAVFEYFNKLDNRIFANIFNLQFLFEFSQVYSTYFLNIYERLGWGLQNAQQRFEQCVRTVRERMPVAFTSLLIKKFTNKKIIKDARGIANRTMKIIIEDVENDQTLPLEHRSFMAEKLKNLKLILGYPEELLSNQNVEEVYKDLKLTGNENLIEHELEVFIFSKKQEFKHLIKMENSGFVRNETTRWIDYTTEDEYITPLYDLDVKNTICK